MSEVISILSFSWNSDSVRVCETLDPNVAIQNRVGVFPNRRQDCNIFNVWTTLSEKIGERKPTIVALSFQEGTRSGSYAFSELFPEEMVKLGYNIFSQVESSTLITGESIQLAVYLRSDAVGQIVERYPPEKYTNLVFGNYKGVAVYLSWLVPQLNQYETLAILNLHSPFNPETVNEAFNSRDISLRQPGLDKQNKFITEAVNRLVFSKPVNHAILMGDLNYRMNPFDSWSATQAGIYYLENARNPEDYPETLNQQDELKLQVNSDLLPALKDFEEGIGNVEYVNQNGVRRAQTLVQVGPLFEPTCKMTVPKNSRGFRPDIRDYNIGGSQDNIVPSHCDRILHSSPREGPRLKVLEYDRIDGGVLTKSDHASIYSIHTFE